MKTIILIKFTNGPQKGDAGIWAWTDPEGTDFKQKISNGEKKPGTKTEIMINP